MIGCVTLWLPLSSANPANCTFKPISDPARIFICTTGTWSKSPPWWPRFLVASSLLSGVHRPPPLPPRTRCTCAHPNLALHSPSASLRHTETRGLLVAWALRDLPIVVSRPVGFLGDSQTPPANLLWDSGVGGPVLGTTTLLSLRDPLYAIIEVSPGTSLAPRGPLPTLCHHSPSLSQPRPFLACHHLRPQVNALIPLPSAPVLVPGSWQMAHKYLLNKRRHDSPLPAFQRGSVPWPTAAGLCSLPIKHLEAVPKTLGTKRPLQIGERRLCRFLALRTRRVPCLLS